MRDRNGWACAFILSVVRVGLMVLLPCTTGRGQEMLFSRPVNSSRVDPALEQYLVLGHLPAIARAGDASLTGMVRIPKDGPGPMIEVLIRGDESAFAAVQSAGGRIGSRHGSIFTALVPRDAVSALAVRPDITSVEASRVLYPSLTVSVPATGADVMHAQSDPGRRVTGKGVIIGFTDSGINTLHRTFRTADDRSRILSVWDQNGSGIPPAGFTYGAEHDSASMNDGRWWMYDPEEHGTHVAGIAAGNGLPEGTLVGMAPEADIIMVCNRPDDLWSGGLTSVGTLDGYAYIRSTAALLGKRHVINTSQGTNLGPHDGTSLFEQAINADVTAGSIICLAAGNEANSARHASASVPPGGAVEIRFRFRTLSPFDSSAIPLEIWYGGSGRLSFRCRKEGAWSYSPAIAPGNTGVIAFDSVTVIVTSIVHSPLNGDNLIRCAVIPVMPITMDDVGMVLRLEAIEDGAFSGSERVDLWWERNFDVAFTDHVDESMTIAMPAGATKAITVGCFENTGTHAGILSAYSAHGPRRDGSLKPDIVAAGGGVTSAVPGGWHRSMSGTSMAAPHVAGAVALLLEHHPFWTPAEVKEQLLSSATADGSTGTLPNSSWGHGKLHAWRAVNGNVPLPAAPVLGDVRQEGEDVVLSWQDPDGGAVRQLHAVYVYRDGSRVDSVVSGAGTYRDRRPGAGKHTYHLTASWSDGWLSARSASLSVELFLAGHPWLLVDDDAGSQWEPYYMSALEATGRSFDRWTTITAGAVTAEVLLQYVRPDGGVIWFCGNDYTATLTPAEQSALSAYLDAGGHLFLSGQDIGYGLTERGTDADRSFYASYLRAQLLLDGTGVFALRGDPGGMFDGMSIGIAGGVGADNQIYPSAITPLAPAYGMLSYTSPPDEERSVFPVAAQDPSRPVLRSVASDGLTGALAYATGNRRVVYFAFGFEAIDSASTRELVMRRVLAFLSTPDTVCFAITRPGTWSLRSVPVRAPSMRTMDVFPGSSAAVLAFGGGYHPLDSLSCGEGFWIRDASEGFQTVCGDTVAGTGIPVRAGWNLIAPFHRPVSVGSVTTTPPGILLSPFFGFTGVYATVSVLQPGHAYWVRAGMDGIMYPGNAPFTSGLR